MEHCASFAKERARSTMQSAKDEMKTKTAIVSETRERIFTGQDQNDESRTKNENMYKSIGWGDDAFRTKQVFEALRRAQSSSQ